MYEEEEEMEEMKEMKEEEEEGLPEHTMPLRSSSLLSLTAV